MRWWPRRHTPVPDELDRRSRGALALFHAGQYEVAARAWAALVADCERELGPDHPETIITLDRYGSALFRLRRLLESADQHREAHRRAIGALGRNAPGTLTYAHNLGCALVVARQWDEGLPVLRDTWQRRRRTLGRAHADTLATAKTLGVSLFMTGDIRTARQMLESAHQAAARAFGPDDPLVGEIAENLAIVRRNSPGF